jgi:hypothetical protein
MIAHDALIGRIIDAANPNDCDDVAIRTFFAANLVTDLTMCEQATESAEISVDPTIAHDELRGRIIDAANPDDCDDFAIRTFLAANLGTVLTMCQQAKEGAEISLDTTIAHDELRRRIIDAANPDDCDDIAIRSFLAANLGTVLTMCQQVKEGAEIFLATTTAEGNELPVAYPVVPSSSRSSVCVVSEA